MMRIGSPWAIGAAASLALPIAAVFIWSEERWPMLLFIGWTAAAALLAMTAWRRAHRDRSARMLEHAQLSAIRTLSHHRHDWMNDLQILYGYLRLRKLDKAVDVVERIKRRMESDSRISHLGVPPLVMFLLSFRTNCDTMRLDVDVPEGFQLTLDEPDRERFSDAVIALVNVFRVRSSAAGAGEYGLRLAFGSEAGGVRVALVCEGDWALDERVRREVERTLADAGLASRIENLTEADRGDPGRGWAVTFLPTA